MTTALIPVDLDNLVLSFERKESVQFMVELNHSPENCITGKRQTSTNHTELPAGIREISFEHGIKVVDGWAFSVGHRLWYVLKATESQAVSDRFFTDGLQHWNTVQTHPVLNHKTSVETLLSQISSEVELAI